MEATLELMSERQPKPVEVADREAAALAEAGVAAGRAWWRRVPLTLKNPAAVFRALREEDEVDVQARSEPITAIAILAGMAGVLLTPAWGSLQDDGTVDGLVVAVVTFVGGAFYGAAAYFVIGLVVWIGAKAVGVDAPFRIARQVVAFAATPIALSLAVTLPTLLALFGGDWFRSGGVDAGGRRWIVLAVGLAFVAWSVALLALGLRTTFRLPWQGVLGALLLAGVLVAAFAVLPSAL